MLKIVTIPNSILNAPVQAVEVIDDSLKKLIIEMEKTLIAQDDPPGVGLAAPQIGKGISLFIIKPSPKAKTEAFINPKIVKTSYNQLKPVTISDNQSKSVKSVKKDLTNSIGSNRLKPKTKLEGCLSIPRIWGSVKRAHKVLLEYQTAEGVKQTKWFTGFKAVIIQHEMDHLEGTLFTKRAVEQNSPLYEEQDGKLKKIMQD